MSELDEVFPRVDSPRALDPEFEERLVTLLTNGSEAPSVRWSIDGPREMPEGAAERIERAMARRRHRPEIYRKLIAASVAVLLVASGIAVADRTGTHKRIPQRPVPVLAAPKPSTKSTPSPAPKKVPNPDALQAFGSARDFLRYVDDQAIKIVGPNGLSGCCSVAVDTFVLGGGQGTAAAEGAPVAMMAPSSAGRTFSGTNIQEAGVDEPDMVKTDGRRMVVLSPAGVSLLNVATNDPRLIATVKLPNAVGAFLLGDRIMVVTSQYDAPKAAQKAVHVSQRQWTGVTTLGIVGSSLRVLSSMQLEGSYVGARLVGGIVRLVVQSSALGPPMPGTYSGTKQTQSSAKAANVRAIASSVVGDWMPHYVLDRPGLTPVTGHVHAWDAISHPPGGAGVSMLTVLTIDPNDPRPNNAVSVIGAGQIVYSSTKNMYVTSNLLDDVIALSHGRTPPKPVTRIHEFDISDPHVARYVGSGEIPGFLLNQYSLSEYNGDLRAASTLSPIDETHVSQSFVTVLHRTGDRLLRIGSVGGLGLGERIYSVRFIGSKGYVVTFRQVDPLYVVDLRVPTAPKVTGRLKVPGYSGYLHPISDTLLLGVGRAINDNEPSGIQFSLFDVTDPAKPQRVAVRTIKARYSYSEVENDPHAFLYWAARRLVVIPASINDQKDANSPPKDFMGALALTLGSNSIGPETRLTHSGRPGTNNKDTSIHRSLVIGNELYTISNAGVLMSDLGTYTSRAWVQLAA